MCQTKQQLLSMLFFLYFQNILLCSVKETGQIHNTVNLDKFSFIVQEVKTIKISPKFTKHGGRCNDGYIFTTLETL